jgi:hypothetical protein
MNAGNYLKMCTEGFQLNHEYTRMSSSIKIQNENSTESFEAIAQVLPLLVTKQLAEKFTTSKELKCVDLISLEREVLFALI